MKLLAYTDGSYDKDTNRCGYGVVFVDEYNNVLNTLCGGFTPKSDENGWSINGEIRAAKEAVRAAVVAGVDEIRIMHDFDGVGMWPQGRWRTTKNYTIEYAEYMRSMSGKIKISYESVKGHNGNRFNIAADKASKEGCRKTDNDVHWADIVMWERFSSTNRNSKSDNESVSQLPPESGSGHDYKIVRRGDEETFTNFVKRVCVEADNFGNRASIQMPSENKAVIFCFRQQERLCW